MVEDKNENILTYTFNSPELDSQGQVDVVVKKFLESKAYALVVRLDAFHDGDKLPFICYCIDEAIKGKISHGTRVIAIVLGISKSIDHSSYVSWGINFLNGWDPITLDTLRISEVPVKYAIWVKLCLSG